MTIQQQIKQAKDGLTQGELDTLQETMPVVICDYLNTWTNVKTEVNEETVNYYYKGFLVSITIAELFSYEEFDLNDEEKLNEAIEGVLIDHGIYDAIDNHGTIQLVNQQIAA